MTIPILLWNLALTRHLPPELGSTEFWRDIPAVIRVPENVLRLAVSLLPFLMPLEIRSSAQRRGVLAFLSGLALYFGSWVALIAAPETAWSTSAIGFVAPAVTPLLWLCGIGMVGRRLYAPVAYNWWIYVILSAAFVSIHGTHALLVYFRTR